MAWDAGIITNASPWATLSTKLKNLVGGTGVENWSFVENVPAGTNQGQSGSASYALDVFRCRGAATLYKRTNLLNLCNLHNTTDGTSFTFANIAPSANQFITIFVFNTKASAADDPTGVSLNGSNAPTFTKIKSQASGAATPLLKGTLWIGKSGGSAPTGTTITVSFGATQTSCGVQMDQWDCCDLTLAVTGVDGTGATQIGIQVPGNNGTTQTVQGVTFGAALGVQSVLVQWCAETASSGTYSVFKAGWAGMGPGMTSLGTPTIGCRSQFRTYQDDLTPTMTLSSATSETDWVAIGLEFQRTTSATSVTSPNDSGIDWYFIIEIPSPDGAVNSSFNCCEDYDGWKTFNRMPPTASAGPPVGIGNQGWRADTLAPYGGTVIGIGAITGNNRTNLTHQILNTSGFNYWIKLTNNAVIMATRVSTSEAANGAMLLDSFVANQSTDCPLIQFATSSASSATMSRLPGVTASLAGTGWACTFRGWTLPVPETFTTNAVNAQDLWAGSVNTVTGKVHVARISTSHTAGRSAANCLTMGYMRGLWKTDFLCLAAGGTVQLGDRMSIGVSNLTSGSLVTGHTYKIITYIASDDFTNVGGANVTGYVFTATGTTPTTWSNSSVLAELNYVVIAKGAFGNTGTDNIYVVVKDV